MTPDVAQLLDELGLSTGPFGVQLVDTGSTRDYIHHSRVPVALVGYTLAVPEFARGKFPKYSFIDLIQQAPSLDTLEKGALAVLCNAPASCARHDPAAFGNKVWEVIERYDLHPFFMRVEHAYGSGGEHFYMRPRGIDWRTDDTIEPELQQWRAAYRAASPLRKLMTATVLQLYRQGKDQYWMVRVKKDWHASEGIQVLKAEGALEDWGALYALYPGW
jgi:hypothetical protein